MPIIDNEIDMFNHILHLARKKAVGVEDKDGFIKGLEALKGVLFHVEMNPLFGGRVVVFSYMLNRVAVLIEDLNDGNLRLSYDVVNDHEAKMKGF